MPRLLRLLILPLAVLLAAPAVAAGAQGPTDGPPPDLVPLTVELAGSGTGVVRVAGAECRATCTVEVQRGGVATVEGLPDTDSGFGGFTGCTSDSNSCWVPTPDARTVVVRFQKMRLLTVNVLPLAGGNVAGGPFGGCQSSCTALTKDGASIHLEQQPGSQFGFTFAGWGGACSGLGATCDLVVAGDTVVSASYAGGAFPTPEASVTTAKTARLSRLRRGHPLAATVACSAACTIRTELLIRRHGRLVRIGRRDGKVPYLGTAKLVLYPRRSRLPRRPVTATVRATVTGLASKPLIATAKVRLRR